MNTPKLQNYHQYCGGKKYYGTEDLSETEAVTWKMSKIWPGSVEEGVFQGRARACGRDRLVLLTVLSYYTFQPTGKYG